jgi:hypothetical protein
MTHAEFQTLVQRLMGAGMLFGEAVLEARDIASRPDVLQAEAIAHALEAERGRADAITAHKRQHWTGTRAPVR